MNLDNTKAQMKKGVLEYCILAILSKDSRYTSDIIQELKEAKVIVVEGTLFTYTTKKCRTIKLPVGRINTRPTQKVL